ncbi:MAG: hypothetical protein KAX19_11925, partial [Candidatus Brocadiae bacterium]|nr:hypothetical protein [Candidatus Brocadiia bacterium]
MKLTKEPDRRDELLKGFEDYLRRQGDRVFQPGRAVTAGRAPARVDCMGGIADYSGSVVFEGPLRRAAVAAFQPRDDTLLQALSVSADADDEPRRAQFDLRAFRDGDGRMKSYEELSALFARDPEAAWSANILGAVAVLEKEGLHR